ncbi:hypothetical protein CI109_100704 [Kwoniella shandongensis]|uniref:Uncharacterized protein n=1 Tax=Kwoniella shandongensis TaxID=1734106 RepID=A0AAJ8LD03_9TREE
MTIKDTSEVKTEGRCRDDMLAVIEYRRQEVLSFNETSFILGRTLYLVEQSHVHRKCTTPIPTWTFPSVPDLPQHSSTKLSGGRLLPSSAASSKTYPSSPDESRKELRWYLDEWFPSAWKKMEYIKSVEKEWLSDIAPRVTQFGGMIVSLAVEETSFMSFESWDKSTRGLSREQSDQLVWSPDADTDASTRDKGKTKADPINELDPTKVSIVIDNKVYHSSEINKLLDSPSGGSPAQTQTLSAVSNCVECGCEITSKDKSMIKYLSKNSNTNRAKRNGRTKKPTVEDDEVGCSGLTWEEKEDIVQAQGKEGIVKLVTKP